MLLQCGTQGAAGDATGWLPRTELAAVAELNELCLALLAEQAAARGAGAGPLLRPFAELWDGLDTAGRRRAAACPYLLLDAGFADAARWRAPPAGAPQVSDAPAGYAAFFTVPAAVGLARLVFIYAWHLARTQPAVARVLLGMSAPAATHIGQFTLRQTECLAERHATWLRPRWPGRAQVWCELLRAAAGGETPRLERTRLRGLTLLAAEARLAGAAEASRGGAGTR